MSAMEIEGASFARGLMAAARADARAERSVRAGTTRRAHKPVRGRTIISGAGKSSGFVDYATGIIYPDDDTTNVALAFTCAQGASTQQRIGRKIKVLSAYVKAEWNGPTATGVTTESSRVALVWDNAPGSSLPASTDIYVTAGDISHTNENGMSRFSILKEFRMTTVGNTTDGTAQANWAANMKPKLVKINRNVVYGTAGTGAIGDIQKGALYLVYMSDSTAASADAQKNALLFNIRVRFADLLA